jgi:hypothetical protein
VGLLGSAALGVCVAEVVTWGSRADAAVTAALTVAAVCGECQQYAFGKAKLRERTDVAAIFLSMLAEGGLAVDFDTVFVVGPATVVVSCTASSAFQSTLQKWFVR